MFRLRQISILWRASSAAVLVLAVLPCLASAAGKPDLVVTGLSTTAPAQLAPGAAFQATAKVKNSGGRGAATSKATFLLSRDSKLGKGDLKLASASIRRLQARGSVPAKKLLRVPSQAGGAYRLLACADVAGKVKERKERNNCRASKGLLRVRGAGQAPGASSQGSQAAPQPFSGSFPLQANPRAVSFEPETGNAVTRMIPTAGGELTAEGEDGTLYTLSFPPDSLFGDTEVTMTPVASLGGATLSGGTVGAVQLEPEGLTLNEPATLEITPSGPLPAGLQTGFLAQGDGDDFHHFPLDFGGGVVMKLMHFTLAGAGGASSGDRSTAVGQMPVSSQAQWEALVADRVNLAKEREAAGTEDGDWPDDLKPVHLAYYRDVVRPAMVAALTDEASVDAGIREGLGWLRKIELYGNASDPDYGPVVDEVYDTMLQILQNALSRSNDACVQSHELRAIRRMVQIARTAQLLGFDLGSGLDLVAKCVRFELDMESRVSGGGAAYEVALKDVLLEASYTNGPLTAVGARGEKQIQWVEFTSHSEYDYECPPGEEPPVFTHGDIDADGTDSPIATAAVTFDISPLQEGAAAPADDTFGALISFNTNEAAEYYLQVQTGGCPVSERHQGFIWENFWAGVLIVHPTPLYEVVKQGEEGGPSTPITTFTKVQRGSGDLFLQVQISGTYDSGGASLTELTSVEVFHRPLG